MCLLTVSQGQSNTPFYVHAALSSEHLLPGEQASFVLRVSGLQSDSRPVIPEVKGVAINFIRTSTYIDSQRRLGYEFSYRLRAVKEGHYTIPPITVTSGENTTSTSPIHFTVHSKDKLLSIPTNIANVVLKAAWFPQKSSLYQNEQCEVLLKIYAPQSSNIVNWGFPDAKKVNCLAWRFSPPQDNGYSQVQLNGISHRVATYSTTLSGIAPGKASLGPASLTLYQRKAVMDPMRGTMISDVPLEITLPQVDFDILALPAGAPADFNGAVGNFDIDARCEKTTFSQTDPTEVILRIGGTGNLTTLQAPTLTGDEWKIIDTSKVTRGEERRYISGIVTFKQLIRAKATQSIPTSIPPYSFSYFNPATTLSLIHI